MTLEPDPLQANPAPDDPELRPCHVEGCPGTQRLANPDAPRRRSDPTAGTWRTWVCDLDNDHNVYDGDE